MRRISSHEPRYKQTTRGRKNKNADSRDQTESSTSEEEEESTDTESETSSESRDSECPQRGSFASVGTLGQRGTFTRVNTPETFMHTRIDGTRILMLDKVTQKNLLSPFPSFTLPPIYKEVVRPGLHRLTERRHSDENETKHLGKPPKHTARKKESHEKEEDSACSIHKNCERSNRKRNSKDKGHKGKGHHSKEHRSQRVLTCMSGDMTIDSRKVLKAPQETETFVKAEEPSIPIADARSRKTFSVARKFFDSREEQQRKIAGTSPGPCVNDFTVKGSQGKSKTEETVKCGGGGGSEVREKLVYVVEEKGKDIKKVETDLFTLNEIFTIKKDLLELSEFAKKLKRMKEMARESENGKNQQNFCHCKPASELLKDVNRRIEALEIRQEELERESKIGQKGDVETKSKKVTDQKTSSESRSNGIEMAKPSALSTVPSFHRMEMILPTADGFSNNSEIVNELMDIKTQLLKLEKRRMSKEISENFENPEIQKPPKVDDRGIAVFSSKTYILTENLKKTNEKKADEEKQICKGNERISKSERMKEDVTNWLKNVSPNHEENDVTIWEMTKSQKRARGWQKETQNADTKFKDSLHLLKYENQENQGREADAGFIDFSKDASPIGHCNRHLQYKECIVTSSGKIFARITKSIAKFPKDSPFEFQAGSHRSRTAKSSSPGRARSVGSSSSNPSFAFDKERVKKLQSKALTKVVESKSLQELSGVSSVSKCEETARNKSLKNSEKVKQPKTKGKRHKEDKNEFVKRLEAHMMAFTKTLGNRSTTSSSYSEFLASINLDTATNSLTLDSSGFQINSGRKDIVMSYAATKENPEKDLAPCCQAHVDEKLVRDRRKKEKKEMKKREAEIKKALKKQIKAYRKEKKQMKKEKKQREKELLWQMKCKQNGCRDKCRSNIPKLENIKIKESKCLPGPVSRPDHTKSPEPREKHIAKEIPTQSNEVNKSKRYIEGEMQTVEFPEVRCGRESEDSSHESVLQQSDSLEIYKKKLRKRGKCKKQKSNPIAEMERLKCIMKNLHLIYPKFCNLISPTHSHHEKKSKKSWHQLCDKHKFRYSESEEDDDDDDDDDDYTEDEDSHDCRDRYEEGTTQRYNYTLNPQCNHSHMNTHHCSNHSQKNTSDHYPNCKCVRVYLQTQLQQGWSGLRAPQKLSSDDSTDLTSSRSAPSCNSNKSSFTITKPKSQICLAAHESTKCKKGEKEDKRGDVKKKSKHKKDHKRKNKHKDKCERRKHHKKNKNKECDDGSLCRCRKCGNVHCKEKHNENEEGGKNEEEEEIEKKESKTKNTPERCPSNRERNAGDIFPMFSFLSHFCKAKPRDAKSSKFSLKRLSEVPRLKTCSNVKAKHPKSSSLKNQKKDAEMSNKTTSEREESRKKAMERETDDECTSQSRADSDEFKRSKKKKRKKKTAQEECSSESKSSFDECKRKKKRGKKKKKKKKNDEECSSETRSGSEESKRKKKKGKKKKKKKRNDEECSSETRSGSEDSRRKKRKKKHSTDEECTSESKGSSGEKKDSKRKKKKKKKKRKKKKCKCGECPCMESGKDSENERRETAAYFQTKISPSACKSLETPTSKTTESSKTSMNDEKKCSIARKLQLIQGKNKRVKEKLTSFHSFWKNLGKSKTPESPQAMEKFMKKFRRVAQEVSPDTSFIDDCSRSSELPSSKQVVELKAEPKPLFKKRKKGKKQAKEEKKEKQTKEKQMTKSKSGRRRHS